MKGHTEWNEYLYKTEENELEKEKDTSQHMEFFASLLDFYREGFVSQKNKAFFVKVFFEKNEGKPNAFQYIIKILNHPNEKVMSNCLRLIETIVSEFPKIVIDEYSVEWLLKDLMKGFLNRKDLLEKTEKSLFNSVFWVLKTDTSLIEIFFNAIKKKTTKLLVIIIIIF